MSRIVRRAERCYGCRTCQLVCSLHHTGSFWPERSSIQVSRNPQTGIVRWALDETCDRCGREEMPLCVQFCSYRALDKRTGQDREELQDE